MLRRTFLLGAAVLLSGCAIHNVASDGILAPGYVQGSVKSVVMFPLLNASKAAVYQPTIQTEMALALQAKNKDLRFMATNEALTRAMTGDAAGELRRLSDAVFNDKPIAAEDLKRVHEVLGIDAAIVCGFTGSDKTVEMPIHILDLRNGQTIWQGVSEGWAGASADANRFSSTLARDMEEGIIDLHKRLPAL